VEKILLFNKFFFQLSIHALVAKIRPHWMCPDGDFLRHFCVLYLRRATLHPLRLGEEKKKKKPQGKNIVSASAMQGGHNQSPLMLARFLSCCYQGKLSRSW